MGALNCSPAGVAIPTEGDLSPTRAERFASSSNLAGATQRATSAEWGARQRGLESALLAAEAAAAPPMSAVDAAECARRRVAAQAAHDPARAFDTPLACAAPFLATSDVVAAGAVASVWNAAAPHYVRRLVLPPVLPPHVELPATPEPAWRRRKRDAADSARRGGGATQRLLRAATSDGDAARGATKGERATASELARYFVRRFPHLTTLDFGVRATTFDAFTLGSPRTPAAVGGVGVDSATIVACARWCPCLTSLSATGCLELGDDAVAALVRHCPRLEHISVCRCRRLTSRSVTLLAVRCGTRLKSLDVSRCRKVDDEAAIAVAAHCPHLESLSIACCVAISSAALVCVAKGCGQLRNIDCAWCPQLTDGAVEAMGQHLAHLECLSVRGCSELTQGALAGLRRRGVAVLDFSTAPPLLAG